MIEPLWDYDLHQWYCPLCDAGLDMSEMDEYPTTLDPNYGENER